MSAYPEEYCVMTESGNEIRCPAYPNPCEYVRIVDPVVGEVAYWDSAEWQEAPEEVMGAILGSLAQTF